MLSDGKLIPTDILSKNEELLIELEHDSWMTYVPDTLTGFDELYQELLALRPTESVTIKMFGKDQELPRKQRMYGRSYTYSGTLIPAEKEIPGLVQAALDYTQIRTAKTPYLYEGVLVNWYKDGQEYVGAHSDDEKDLSGGPIFSFSFGAPRLFRVRKITPKSAGVDPIVLDIELQDGSLLVMGGNMQKYYKHEIVKTKKPRGPRINMTVRSFSRKTS